jgi:hypothetical protein
MWLDHIHEAHTPDQIARALLATNAEEMLVMTRDVDLDRLVDLSDRLSKLMLGLTRLPRHKMLAKDSDWSTFAGSRVDWPAYGPSVMAGAFGLSCALDVAFREEMLGATMMLSATNALEALPRSPPDPDEYEEIDAFVVAFRTYALVPLVSGIRFVWVALADARDKIDRGSKLGPRALSVFRQSWVELTKSYEPLDPVSLIRGLVLMQVAPFIDSFAGSRATQPLDFSDLPSLAAHEHVAIARHKSAPKVANAFQARLTALFRSFNGPVVSAAPGDPLGDIYYELPEGNFILIDAKSTGSSRGYTLPESDADALRRYVKKAPEILPSGRSVVAVLIVGPSPGSSLERRLRALEDSVRCPVRFAAADQMLGFRNSHPGGSIVGFPEALSKCSMVLPDGWWQPIVERARADNARLQEYVQKGLALSKAPDL